jgi:hypothetical protein
MLVVRRLVVEVLRPPVWLRQVHLNAATRSHLFFFSKKVPCEVDYKQKEITQTKTWALMRRGDGAIDEEMLARLRSNVDGATLGTFDFSEKDTATNDRLAIEGLRIINAGAKWRGVPLSDIHNGKKFTITHPRFDALTGITSPGTDTWNIDDGWRRGFDIGIGTAQGNIAEESRSGSCQRRSSHPPSRKYWSWIRRRRSDSVRAYEICPPLRLGSAAGHIFSARILALDRPAVGDSINAARPRIEALTEEAKATATLGESISGQGKVVPVSVSKEAKATRVSVLPSC